jgi:hypothetical protein
MVSIIKTLADDPLSKPEMPELEEPEREEEEAQQADKNEMKTAELSKAIFRIGNLLQMSFGQLGAVIVNSNGTTGDGSLEINIPGKMQNVIFMSCRLSGFVKIAEGLEEHTNTFLNQMLNIIHKCTARWDGSANKNDGDVYLITWLLPSTE